MELQKVFLFDEDGFFAGLSSAQPDPMTGNLLMPPQSTLVSPSFKDGYFFQFVNGTWVDVAKPTTAAECAAIGEVSHYTHNAHDEELRQLFQALTEGNDEYRVERGDDLSWKVVKVPEKSPEEKRREEIEARIAELKGKLSETDYVVIKIAEGEATESEYADVLANRKAWREEINRLQKELEEL